MIELFGIVHEYVFDALDTLAGLHRATVNVRFWAEWDGI